MTVIVNDSVLSSLSRELKELSILQAFALLWALLLTRWFIRGIYRVYFHQLSRFPGPKLSAFTRIPHLHATATGSLHRYITRLHDKYGDVVRISPDELSFLNPHAWRDIYGYGAKAAHGSAPPKYFERYSKAINGIESLVNTKSNAEHGRVRRMFSPAFSDRALTQQAPLFQKYVDQLVQILTDRIEENRGEETFDMVRMYNFTTFDVMGDLTFGEPLHMLDNQRYDDWVKMIFQVIKLNLRLSLITTYYPLASKILRPVLEKLFAKKKSQHFNHAATRVTKRLEKGRESQGVDIWDLVLSQEEMGKESLSRGQMDANASLFMTAGTETTATLLSGLTYFLLKNPDSMRKLTQELRGAFACSADISLDAIAGLQYLNSCIKEGLRRYPPVPVGLPHQTPSNGSTICGHYVPAGITVAAHHFSMYNSPKIFKDPLSFIPERWTGDEQYAEDVRTALQPFSVGSRDCLGKNMAYHEMRLILANIIYKFDLELCVESEGWADQETYTLWEKQPLMVKVKVANTE